MDSLGDTATTVADLRKMLYRVFEKRNILNEGLYEMLYTDVYGDELHKSLQDIVVSPYLVLATISILVAKHKHSV